MKKFVLLFAVLFSNVAFADYYKTYASGCDDASMRAALDQATVEGRAVITVVECDNSVKEKTETYTNTYNHVYADTQDTCGSNVKPVYEVVQREYFVRETVQEYKPVVKYVPTKRYTRVRRACSYGC